MRNKVSSLLILISIFLLTASAIRGIHIGNFNILSISELLKKEDVLDEKIKEASNLTSKDYENTIQVVEETFDKYIIKKQKYEGISEYTNETSEDRYEKKQYDIGYLWRTLGKNATSRNLTLGMDVKTNANKKESLYNLHFTVAGQYVNIAQFIADLENNSDLSFRIYNFKMSGSERVISATFTVKNVKIDPLTLNKVS